MDFSFFGRFSHIGCYDFHPAVIFEIRQKNPFFFYNQTIEMKWPKRDHDVAVHNQ